MNESGELREFVDALRRVEERLLNSFLVRVARSYFLWSIWLLGLVVVVSLAPFLGYSVERFVASPPYMVFLLLYFVSAVFLIHFRRGEGYYSASLASLMTGGVDPGTVRRLHYYYVIAWTATPATVFPLTYVLINKWFAWVVALPLFLGLSNMANMLSYRIVLKINTTLEIVSTTIFFVAALAALELSRYMGMVVEAIYVSLVWCSLAYLLLGYMALSKALR